MASFVTNRGAKIMADGTGPWATGTDIRAALLNSSAAPTKDTNTLSELTANEIAGAGYSRQALTGETATEDDTNDRVKLTCDNIAFGSIVTGETIGWVVFYKHNAADASAEVMVVDDVANTPTNGAAVTYVPHADGVAYLST